MLERNSPAVGSNGALIENVGLEVIGGGFPPLLKTGCAMPCIECEGIGTAATPRVIRH